MEPSRVGASDASLIVAALPMSDAKGSTPRGIDSLTLPVGVT